MIPGPLRRHLEEEKVGARNSITLWRLGVDQHAAFSAFTMNLKARGWFPLVVSTHAPYQVELNLKSNIIIIFISCLIVSNVFVVFNLSVNIYLDVDINYSLFM